MTVSDFRGNFHVLSHYRIDSFYTTEHNPYYFILLKLRALTDENSGVDITIYAEQWVACHSLPFGSNAF